MKLTDIHELERLRARIRTLTAICIKVEAFLQANSKDYQAASEEEWRDMTNAFDKYSILSRSELEGD